MFVKTIMLQGQSVMNHRKNVKEKECDEFDKCRFKAGMSQIFATTQYMKKILKVENCGEKGVLCYKGFLIT